MAFELELLRIARIATAIMGFVLTWLAYKGYRRGSSKGLLFLSIGFAIIGIGTVVEGVLFEFFNYSILTVHLIESIIVALGLLFMVYAVYGVAD